ncbi:MAG: tRNA (adenosine(37)-N6)-threonylcarbamoyltransferase complex ATPase subunit type 1 TsaE [Pyrinomonadaceae bacterium]|nr:tRNA (adenosine(37)-N6)-threonylcarbamoyltransferase complex ATPase subunit type 1 TsaE [Pyrinomonadaceae bacterium]
MQILEQICAGPDDTFKLGEQIGKQVRAGDVLMLFGGLGAGKTLFTKGILHALDYDIDEVTSPSFTLVNLYKTPDIDVYHIDLWRLSESSDVATEVGLDEILHAEDSAVIIEWAEKLTSFTHDGRIIRVSIEGDGDEPRRISIDRPNE